MIRVTAFLIVALAAMAPSAFAQARKDPPSGEPEAKKEEKKEEPRRGGGGPFGGGDPSQYADQVVEFLSKELDLDSDQKVKVKEIFGETMKSMWSRMGEFMGGGGDMMENARKAMEDVRVELAKKISKVLTPAQQREFENLVDQFDRRAQSFEQTQRAWEAPDQLFNPKPIAKRLFMGKAERSLFLGPEETAVVMPFVEKLIDARMALYEGRKVRRQDLKNAMDGGASKDEVTQRVADIRAAEQFQQLEILAASQALRELLTIGQEARFVAMDLLE